VDLSQYPDAYVTDAANGTGITVDPQKGVVVVLFDSVPAGGISASLGAAADPVVDLSDVLVFFNAAPGTTTVSVSPSSCRPLTPLTPYPVLAHTVTLVDVTCD